MLLLLLFDSLFLFCVARQKGKDVMTVKVVDINETNENTFYRYLFKLEREALTVVDSTD
jgi:hypothetical protein